MANDERDEESGKFTEKYPTEDFLQAIREEGGVAGTTDIANRVGVIRSTAFQRLERLEEDGIVVKKDIGNSAAWILPEEDSE